MKITFLLGSNQGNKVALLKRAVKEIENIVGKVIQHSSFYSTEPWGFECNEDFINQAIVVETDLSPIETLDKILALEIELGRDRTTIHTTYVSRPIDIDILFCEELIINHPRLTVPHPRIQDRNFALVPLKEIMSNFIHPTLHKTIKVLTAACTDKNKVVLFNE